MALLNIIYDGNDAKSYQAVEISFDFLNKECIKLFNSGNLAIDWYNAKKYYLCYIQQTEPFLSTLSSCDHFFMDGGDKLYDSAYLVMDGENPVLHYDKNKDGWEFFVNIGTTPTFQELKELTLPYWPKDLLNYI